MSQEKPPFTVIPGGGGQAATAAAGNGIDSPSSPPGVNFSSRERKAWDYICESLRLAGIEHMTGGLAISVVVRTWIQWQDAENQLSGLMEKNRGSYMVTTPNGHQQPHAIFYVARNLKKELLQWLPECCLTLPSVATVKAKLPAATPQDDLFDGLVGHAKSHPSAA
ncbi:P27 family phage terminase small subunit [Aquitalea aquatilis]|uniref:P27 family phage terminase small subunit n=1 Tax=Aquitalea aquatilis TaxID=1537400 RepID=UPI001FE6B0A9|nr:P27 family phage terminase small subunit [Aquitalea aquatilis]